MWLVLICLLNFTIWKLIYNKYQFYRFQLYLKNISVRVKMNLFEWDSPLGDIDDWKANNWFKYQHKEVTLYAYLSKTCHFYKLPLYIWCKTIRINMKPFEFDRPLHADRFQSIELDHTSPREKRVALSWYIYHNLHCETPYDGIPLWKCIYSKNSDWN